MRNEMEKILIGLSELHNTVMASFVPEEARKHLFNSRKEALLGIKAILQQAIDGCDKHGTGHSRSNRQPSRSIKMTD